MSNPLLELRKLLNPQHVEHIGTIQNANHPNYKVLVGDDSGLTLCTSNVPYNVGAKVYFSNGEIKRPAPNKPITYIEI